MSDYDPFASAPDEAQTETPAAEPEAPKKTTPRKTAPKAAAAAGSEGKITVTLKGGTGFDAPWIVIHADDAADAAEQIGVELFALMERTQVAAGKFAEMAPNKPASSGGGGRQSAPAGAASPPAGSPDMPAGWAFRSGVNKNTGKPWKGYFPPQGDDSKPIFF